MNPLEALAEIERRAIAAINDVRAGSAVTGVSALKKINDIAADAQRHHQPEKAGT